MKHVKRDRWKSNRFQYILKQELKNNNCFLIIKPFVTILSQHFLTKMSAFMKSIILEKLL